MEKRYIIATDVSDKKTVDLITNVTGFKANIAPAIESKHVVKGNFIDSNFIIV